MPFNGAGTFSLVAGNPVVTGTVISSTVQNNTMSDIANNGLSNCLTKDGQQTPTNNIPMGGFRITGLGDAVNATDAVNARQIQTGAFNTLSVVTGTDTITGVTSPSFGSYAPGQRFQFLSAGANTTNSVTLNINSLGAKNVLKSGATPIVPGDIATGQMVTVVYDGTQFELVSPASIPNHGNCRVNVTGATTIQMVPYNGNSLIINGAVAQIPSAGVTYTISGLAATTLYRIYAFMNAGVMTLEASTTGHVTGSNGVEVKSGDPTRTLVALAYTNASVQFVDGLTTRTFLNWFNRKVKPINVAQASNSTSSTSLIQISTTFNFLTWGDEGFNITSNGYMSNTTGGPTVFNRTNLFVNGASFGNDSIASFTSNNTNYPLSNNASAIIAEGLNTFALVALVNSGNGTFNYAFNGFVVG
jgi:hypothetical protein